MEKKASKTLEKHAIFEEFPSLITYITSKRAACSDTNIPNPQIDIFANGSKANEHHCSHSISISLPAASPSKFTSEGTKNILFTNDADHKNIMEKSKLATVQSQMTLCENSFETTLMHEIKGSESIETKPISVHCSDQNLINPLEVHVLDSTPKKSEKQPFLIRVPISCFSICLGFGSQVILWKTLAMSPSTRLLQVSLNVNLVLWCTSLALMVFISVLYIFKIIFYFEAVQREYYHPIKVNFFFAPWVALLLLAIGTPPSIAVNLPCSLWYVLMAPILCLELKIYGQWMVGGNRRLSKVANPSNHLSIIGNFVGALLGSSMGLKEGPLFFFAVGLAHYTVLFVTLYQRLPTNQTLPKELHPVFFLFVGAPSVACVSWENIIDEFYIGARIIYFIAIFLYFSLAVRINFFRGFKFSLAWWAYTFPMTSASTATIRYANEVKNPFTQSLSIALSSVSTIIVAILMLLTIFHAFVLRDLFPNDISMAITQRLSTTSDKQIDHTEECLSEDNIV